MATYAENLVSARDAYATELALGNVKPTYSIEGQNVDWNAYRASLLDSIARLNGLIDSANGPWEVITEGMP